MATVKRVKKTNKGQLLLDQVYFFYILCNSIWIQPAFNIVFKLIDAICGFYFVRECFQSMIRMIPLNVNKSINHFRI